MITSYTSFMQQAAALPKGAAKLALLEEAVRMADSAHLLKEAAAARQEILDTAIFCGHPLKAIVAFSWLQAQWDKYPDYFDDFDMLWNYKWILSYMPNYPQVTISQLEQLLEEMRTRYHAHGYNDHAYYSQRAFVYRQCGNKQMAAKSYEAWEQQQRDGMSDCRACDQNSRVLHFAFMKDDEKALQMAEPILTGQLKCAEVPHITYAHLLASYCRLGMEKEAAQAHRKGLPLIMNQPEHVYEQGLHIIYACRQDLNKALQLFEQHWPLTVGNEDPMSTMYFHVSGMVLLKRLAASGREFHVRPPAGLELASAQMDTPAWAAWFEKQAMQLAKRFDERNGNSFYTNDIQEILEENGCL